MYDFLFLLLVFLDKILRFNQLHAMAVTGNVAISNIQNVHYRCIIFGVSKSEDISLLKNSDLNAKRELL